MTLKGIERHYTTHEPNGTCLDWAIQVLSERPRRAQLQCGLDTKHVMRVDWLAPLRLLTDREDIGPDSNLTQDGSLNGLVQP